MNKILINYSHIPTGGDGTLNTKRKSTLHADWLISEGNILLEHNY